MRKLPKPPIYLYPSLLIIGMGIAALSLVVNQQFHVSLSLASMFSPTGAQVTLGGFRIKHWLVGGIIIIIGGVTQFKEEALIKQAGIVAIGIGTMLLLDEPGDVIRTFTTGQYP